MSHTIFSSADISVSQYPFDRITDLRMVKQVNDHAKLTVTGIVSEDVLDKYVEQVEADEVLQVTVKDKDRTIPPSKASLRICQFKRFGMYEASRLKPIVLQSRWTFAKRADPIKTNT